MIYFVAVVLGFLPKNKGQTLVSEAIVSGWDQHLIDEPEQVVTQIQQIVGQGNRKLAKARQLIVGPVVNDEQGHPKVFCVGEPDDLLLPFLHVFFRKVRGEKYTAVH